MQSGNSTFEEGLTKESTSYSDKRTKPVKPGFLSGLYRLIGILPRTGEMPLQESDTNNTIGTDEVPYDSFMPFAPFKKYDPVNKHIVSDDGKRAVFLNILPADIEGRDTTIIEEIAEKISIAFENIPNVMPQWVVQIYINDEPMDALIHETKAYYDSLNSYYGHESFEFQKEWVRELDKHFKLISRKDGIFMDEKSRLNWRGKFRRVRMVIYQNTSETSPQVLNNQVVRLTEGLNEAGIRSNYMTGKMVYDWLMPWYSGEREKAYSYIDKGLYPEEEELNDELPFSFDLGNAVIRNKRIESVEYFTPSINGKPPEKQRANDHWLFGDKYCRYITLKPYNKIPNAALWSAETSEGSSAFDRMPDGSILATTIIIEPQDVVEGNIQSTIHSSIGDGKDAELTEIECNEALNQMARGNKLISWLSGIYVDANSLEELNKVTARTVAAANATGYEVIETKDDILNLDNYVRRLPMTFDPVADKKTKRLQARMVWDTHATRQFPLFCRGRGTRRPGLQFNSRVGEPIAFDPLSTDDREKNAHMLILGPTGSGKTATLISMLNSVTAAHKPRLFLITTLPTFEILGDYYESHGLKVNRININGNNPPSLPPFSDITRIITDEIDIDDDLEDEEESVRDILDEAALACRLMVTGGDAKEEENFTKGEKSLIKQSIVKAAQNVLDQGRDQALTEDVIFAMKNLSEDQEKYNKGQRDKLSEMSLILEMYTMGFDGKVFNRGGEAWEDADATIVQLGSYGDTSKKDQMSVAIVSLLNKINNLAEDNKESKRNIITAIDEAHDLVSVGLVTEYLKAKAAKGRTFGSWLWLATQNLHQFPDEAKALLNQPEWWILLNTEKEDVEQISRFKTLTAEQRTLLESARKQKYCFTEGIVMSKKLLTLFRNVPPASTLSIALTEKEERARRALVAKENKCSLLEGAMLISEEYNDRRRSFKGDGIKTY